MILHASFSVDVPERAAKAVAELMGGEAFALPEFNEKAWMSLAGDDVGTLIQFLPRGVQFRYVQDATVAHAVGVPFRESAFHLLIETPLDQPGILDVARRHGCRAHQAMHGPLALTEFWIDECVLIEVVTAEQPAAYKSMATLANMRMMAA